MEYAVASIIGGRIQRQFGLQLFDTISYDFEMDGFYAILYGKLSKVYDFFMRN